MDLFNTLGTSLYPSGMIDRADSDESNPRCPWNQPEENDALSNHYNDERNERMAESVYSLVSELSEDAVRLLLEEHLVEAVLASEDFAYTVEYQKRKFVDEANARAEVLSNA